MRNFFTEMYKCRDKADVGRDHIVVSIFLMLMIFVIWPFEISRKLLYYFANSAFTEQKIDY